VQQLGGGGKAQQGGDGGVPASGVAGKAKLVS